LFNHKEILMNRPTPAPNDKVVIVGAKRTPFGAFGGSLKAITATDLAVEASKAVLQESRVSPEQIDHVIFGNVIPSSSDAAYLARHVGLKSGIPLTTPALTLNRLCGSGFEAMADGVRRLKLGEATTVLVGGTENMSQAPFTLRKSRFGYRMGNGELEDTLVAGLYDSYAQLPMALTAERLAEKYSLTRDEVDSFAVRSHHLAAQAYEQNIFIPELAPLAALAKDEHLRPNASLDSLKKLSPVFKKDGVVTAGNASGICDGAAALILTLESTAKRNQWNVLATWEGSSVVGCEPKEMGIGPVSATHSLLQQSNRSANDIRLIEINEAFAAQVLAVQKELRFPDAKLNVDGGAIALGHPLAASGARLAVHLVHRLRNLGGGLGIGTACIGGGQGIAVLLKVE
jgi:acetyl-CoA acyltransferase 2